MPAKRPRRKWALLLLLPLIWGLLHFVFRSRPLTKPLLISHRGAAGLAPENTLAAVQAGLMHGADMIEVDVQRSADGVLLLLHDAQVDETTNGSGAVAELEWSELSRLDAGSHFSVHHAGEHIPTLAETLQLIKSDTATLLIEMKDPATYPGIENDLLDLIQREAAQQQVIVISFQQEWLAQFHTLAPDIPLSVLTYWPLQLPQVSEAKFVGVVWPAVFLDPTLIYRLHRAGHQVFVFTVNDPQIMRWLLTLGVDGIITDRPDVWSHVLD